VERVVYGMAARNIIVIRTVEGKAVYFGFPQLFRKTEIVRKILHFLKRLVNFNRLAHSLDCPCNARAGIAFAVLLSYIAFKHNVQQAHKRTGVMMQ
jgi:hypothetical protein